MRFAREGSCEENASGPRCGCRTPDATLNSVKRYHSVFHKNQIKLHICFVPFCRFQRRRWRWAREIRERDGAQLRNTFFLFLLLTAISSQTSREREGRGGSTFSARSHARNIVHRSRRAAAPPRRRWTTPTSQPHTWRVNNAGPTPTC